MYTKKTESKKADQIVWRCVKRDDPVPCSATLQTTKTLTNPLLQKSHTHEADQNAITLAKCRDNMKRKADTSCNRPNQIYTAANAQLPDEVKAILPSSDTCKRVLRRARSRHHPPEPQRLQDFIVDGSWSLTTGEDPQQFLLYDNGPDADERIVMFGTVDQVQKLATSDVWCMDGNFAMAPRIFKQLYVIQGRVSGVFVPLVYILLQRKTQTSYESMLHILEDHGCFPTVVIIDFEQSVDNALRAVFGNHVQTQFCFYHLTQATWRQIQSLGLTNTYKDDNEFRLYCGQLDALAFLPIDQVPAGMNHLKETMPEPAEPLVEYFDRTYVSGKLRQVPQQNGNNLAPIRIRRVPPLFAPDKWNMHQVTMDNQPRTNNISEGWNNKFTSLVGEQHPSVWTLIGVLQQESERVKTVLLQNERSVRPKKRSTKVYAELQSRLRNLCEDLQSGTKTVPQFLTGISHNIRFGQPSVYR